MYLNVRGLRTETKSVYESMLSTFADIIYLTETWQNGCTGAVAAQVSLLQRQLCFYYCGT